MRDAYYDTRSIAVINPVAMTTANANGTGIDLLGYRTCRLVVQVGTSTALLGGSNYATIRFMESTDNSTFTAIADANLIGGNNTQVIDANSETPSIHQRSYIGSARYVTVRIEPTATIAVVFSASAERGKPLHGPIA